MSKSSGQVEIKSMFGKIYLYTHSNAHSLVNNVHDALSELSRWDDPDYLSKMIFCRMVPQEEWESDNGYGIGTQLYVDINLLVSLDTVTQMITIQSLEEKHEKYVMSFKEFVTGYIKNADI
jgi:hypothetical protein